MMSKLISIIKKIPDLASEIQNINQGMGFIIKEIDETKILLGKFFSEYNNKNVKKILSNIQLAEFKVFSQWGDDGIIQFLINYLDINNKVFIEFGVENYREANTRFLLINNNWSGLIIDGSEQNINSIKNEEIYWRYHLEAKKAFITKENINKVISESGVKGNIGLLHIDIDGNDYWVWKEINVIEPDIVIMEYNSLFGDTNPWVIPYKHDFYRTKAHYSNLYFGSSLQSLCDLAKEKGYIFIGCNSNGNNAYFIKKEKSKRLKAVTCKNGYVKSKFREGRDNNGALTYLSDDLRLKQIKNMPILNTRTNKIETIK